MGSLERRIEDLEGRIKPPEAQAYNPEREAIIAELERLEQRDGPLRQRAEREAEEGDPRRLHALQNSRSTYGSAERAGRGPLRALRAARRAATDPMPGPDPIAALDGRQAGGKAPSKGIRCPKTVGGMGRRNGWLSTR